MVSFLKSVQVAAALPPVNLNLNDQTSIQGVARTLAAGTMSYYSGTSTTFADLPQPYYWWECGALMGAMLDYSHYTNDSAYDGILTKALSYQLRAPDYDLMVPEHYGDEGNDDQAFWGFAIMSAAERNFPQADDPTLPSWLTVGENIFTSLSGRWNTSACNGGLLWQIFASNPNGLNYRNTVSNGGLFQLAARLYRATGNETYLDWANKVWDWTTGVGLIDDKYNVRDGASSTSNCTDVNPVTFSYSTGIYLYGAAVMANVTADDAGAQERWVERARGLLDASRSFFSPYENASNVMFEHACETVGSCNTDMKSFKGYLSRFMYASAVMLPSLRETVAQLLGASAEAAANTCQGGADGTTCGQKWYVGGFDHSVGLGQEMSALETVQGLLAGDAPAPLRAGEIQDVRGNRSRSSSSSSSLSSSSSAVATPMFSLSSSSLTNSAATSTASSTNSKRSSDSAGSVAGVQVAWLVVGLVAAISSWGTI